MISRARWIVMDVRPTTTMTWFMIAVGLTVAFMLGRVHRPLAGDVTMRLEM
jgi:hypothetical protein